jgi:hypothetical protein
VARLLAPAEAGSIHLSGFQFQDHQACPDRLDEGLRFKQQALARDPRSLVLVHIAISCFSKLDSAFPAFPTFLLYPMVGERARNVKPM